VYKSRQYGIKWDTKMKTIVDSKEIVGPLDILYNEVVKNHNHGITRVECDGTYFFAKDRFYIELSGTIQDTRTCNIIRVPSWEGKKLTRRVILIDHDNSYVGTINEHDIRKISIIEAIRPMNP